MALCTVRDTPARARECLKFCCSCEWLAESLNLSFVRSSYLVFRLSASGATLFSRTGASGASSERGQGLVLTPDTNGWCYFDCCVV